MKNNHLLKLAIAAALSLTALSASAEDAYNGAWYALPGVNYAHTDNELKADDNFGFSLKAGKEINAQWDIQGGLSYNRARNDVAGVSGSFKQTALTVDALYFFSRDQIRPFLLAGVGIARNNVDYSAPGEPGIGGSNTSWLANVGAGAQYLYTEQFGVQADLRYQVSRVDTNDGPDGNIGNTILSLGAIYRFDAPTPVAAKAEVPAPAPVAVVPVVKPAPVVAPVVIAAPVVAPVVDTAIKVEVDNTFRLKPLPADNLFDFGNATLKDGAIKQLDDAAAQLKTAPKGTKFTVSGHTDRIGSDAANKKLSQARADAVKAYLVKAGVDAGQLNAIGHGETQPVAACKDVAERKALIDCLSVNRRVVIWQD